METLRSSFSDIAEFNEYMGKIDTISIDESLVLSMKELSQERYRQWIRLTNHTRFMEPVNIVACLGLFSAVGNMKHLDKFIDALMQKRSSTGILWRIGPTKWFVDVCLMEIRLAAALIEQLQLRAIKPFYHE